MTKNSAEPLVMPGWLRSWERFWFTPADPTVLGLIRLSCGLITVYTLFAYSFQLQVFMGPHAWYDLQLRTEVEHDRAVYAPPLWGTDTNPPVTPAQVTDPDERAYAEAYAQKWGVAPPRPFPRTPGQAGYIDAYRQKYGFDPRLYGLAPPATDAEREYLEKYTERWRQPPPAYARSAEEARQIDDYIERQQHDPRRLYARGTLIWSVWLHVTDPTAMAVVHGLIVLVAFLFAIGFASRVTAVLTWFGAMCYIHRNPNVLFGVDTMMTILLTYLMIGPSGAALSVDRLIARWWRTAKPAAVRRWYRLRGLPEPADADIAPAAFAEEPAPSVTANVAIRLLQVHVCIIYLMAGLSKLQGTSWWNGTAVWGTVANFEFAPMQYAWYTMFLRRLAGNQFLIELFLTTAGYFTLLFEIGYAFLIWRPATRWLVLTGAILLHGLIGLFMGLKTFSLMMLVMNLAFLRPEEVAWIIRRFIPAAAPTPAPARAPEPAIAGARK